MALEAVFRALHRHAKAIFVETSSGRMARDVSRLLPGCPVIALTHSHEVARRLQVCRGVRPVVFKVDETYKKVFGVRGLKKLVWTVIDETMMPITTTETVVGTMGHPIMERGATDALVVSTVGALGKLAQHWNKWTP